MKSEGNNKESAKKPRINNIEKRPQYARKHDVENLFNTYRAFTIYHGQSHEKTLKRKHNNNLEVLPDESLLHATLKEIASKICALYFTYGCTLFPAKYGSYWQKKILNSTYKSKKSGNAGQSSLP